MSSELFLDTLAPKQRAKEFKTVGKAVKNKDEAIKLEALKKLAEDPRYVTEGGCILPLLEIMVPKKKTLEFTETAVEAFVTFLRPGPKEAAEGEEEAPTPSAESLWTPSIEGLETIKALTSSLDSLKVLSELMVYKDNVKLPKPPKVKKGETPPPPPPPPADSQLSINLRRNSLKSVFYIAEALVNTENKEELKAMFSEIEDLTPNLCATIIRLVKLLMPPPAKETPQGEEGEEANEGGDEEPAAEPEPELSEEEVAAKEAALVAAEEECEWALITMALLVATSAQACKTLLASEASALLPALMQLRPAFTLPLLQILLAVARQDSEDIPGLTYVTAPDVFSVLVQAGASTSEALCAAEAGESGVCDVDDPLRLSLSHLNVIVDLMSHVAAMQKTYPDRINSIDVPRLAVIVPAVNGALLSQKVWEISRTPGPSGDTSLAGFASRCCALLGTIAEVSQALRQALSDYPTASTLLSLLKAGRQVVGEVPVYAVSEEDSEETRAAKEEANIGARAAAVGSLRRATEKAFLTIVSVDEADKGAPDTRWGSCGVNKTDLTLFEAPVAETEEANTTADADADADGGVTDTPKMVAFPSLELVSLLDSVGEDDELADRATRLLAALALGSPDSTAFAGNNLQMDPEALCKLGAVLLARAKAVVEKNASDMSAKPEEGPIASSDEAMGEEKSAETGEGEGEKKEDEEGGAPAEAAAAPAFVPDALGPRDLSTPSAQEVLYLGLAIVEACVAAGADHVIAFATEEIVAALSEVIFTSGPTSVSAAASETEVALFDVRDMSWAPREQQTPEATDRRSKAFLRPLCLDVLAMVMTSDAKFRVYEPLDGEEEAPTFPLAAGAEDLASSSVTEECALRVCRIATDSIIATLTTEVAYTCNDSASMEVYACPSGTDSGVLASPVLKAALGAAAAVGSCGRAGLETALKALADAGFPAEETGEEALFSTGAMKGLIKFLEAVKAPAAKKAEKPAAEEAEEPAEEEKGDLGEGEPEAPPTVGSALAGYSWALPDTFVDVIAEDLPTSARNLLQQPVLWPFVSFLGPAVAVLRGPAFDSETAKLALKVVASASTSAVHAQGTQPVCHDVFCASLVSMGGVVALAGASGAFGHLSDGDGGSAGVQVTLQVASRGHHSEEFWRSQHAPPEPQEGEETEVAETEAPPPHTGPSEALWGAMLRLPVDDRHIKCQRSYALTSALQNASSALSVELISRGADINAKDSFGRSALMYALVMRDEEAFRALLAASPSLELTDDQGNPTAKYALLSLPEAEVQALTVGKQREDRPCLCSGPFASDLFSAGADVNTADTDGNSILQLAVGLAAIDMTIGGVNLKISTAAYVDEAICPKEATLALCDQLLSTGAKVNTCNKDGVTALHVVAARGHNDMIKLFLHYHVAPCIKDRAGMLPLHYVAACCPTDFRDTFELVMKISDNRPLLHGTFDDERLKKDEAERKSYDIDVAFDEVFSESLVPSCIAESRLSREDLLLHLTSDRRSLFQLVLAGHVLADGFYTPFVSTSAESKGERLRAAIYLCTDLLTGVMGIDSTVPGALGAKVSSVVGSVSDLTGFNSLHAASLLLQGVTERVPLTPAQKRSKRVRSYESAELHVLDLVSSLDVGATTTQAVKGAKGWVVVDGDAWSALHAAIWANNPPLVRTLAQQADLSAPVFAGLGDCLLPPGAASEEVIKVLVAELSDSPSWASHLSPSLLGSAVRTGNSALIAALVAEPKMNPNVQVGEGSSRCTALHTAVEAAAAADADEGSMAVLQAFAGSADRLDMCVEDAFGNTCVDAAVASRSQPLISALLAMRRNDVIERILTSRNGGPSLLFELEEENMQKAKDAGYYVGEEPPVAPREGEASVVEPTVEQGPETVAANGGVDAAVDEADGGAEEVEILPEGEAEVEAEIEVIDSLETNVASFNPTTEEDLRALKESNVLVKGLIDAVAGLVSEDCHCHKCYHEGMTYSEYVLSRM